MKLKTAFSLSGWLLVILLMAYNIFFNTAGPPPVSDTTAIVDVIPDIDDDDSFTWFPDTIKVAVPFAVPGPIRYLPTDPDTVYVDSSKEQVIALKDYIARQYIFKLRYVQPKLQVSYISADTTSADSLNPYYILAEYELPPAFQLVPLRDGTYDVQRMELVNKPPIYTPPAYTIKHYAGIRLLAKDTPIAAYYQSRLLWKKTETNLGLYLGTNAAVTANLSVSVRIR